MYTIYRIKDDDKMTKCSLKFDESKIMYFLNEKSLELGATKSISYPDEESMKVLETLYPGEERFKSGRINKMVVKPAEIIRIHDFWEGQRSYYSEGYTCYQMFYDESSVILALVESLKRRNDVLGKLSSDNKIIQNYYLEIFKGIPLEEYLLDDTNPKMISFDKLLPFIETDKQILIEMLNEMQITATKDIDYNRLKHNVLKKIALAMEISKSKNPKRLSEINIHEISKKVIKLLDESYNETAKIARSNEKVLRLTHWSK